MTISHLLLASAHVAITGAVAVIGSLQQPPRDLPAARRSGSSSITGIVTSDEPAPRPLRRVRVMLRGADPLGSAVVTNDDGTFAFEGLEAGGYTVGAAKDAYVTSHYGAIRTGGAGQRIVLRDREVKRIAIRLPRGAVITGSITDGYGQPASGVTVSAMMWQYSVATGEQRLVPAGLSAGPTDERGQYRIYGLPAGDYLVGARRGEPLAPTLLAPRGPETSRVAAVPILYPGTTSIDAAAKIAVSAGEERAGVNFTWHYTPTSLVSGWATIQDPDARSTSLSLVSASQLPESSFRGTTLSGVNVSFAFNGVPPGRYRLVAKSQYPSGRVADLPGAIAEVVVVEGQDLSNVQLSATVLPSISGRLVFEGTTRRPAVPRERFDLPLQFRNDWRGLSIPAPSLRIDDDWRFSMARFVPGFYVLVDPSRGLRSPISGWWIKSIVLDGRDLLDAPLELRHSENVIVTMSDRASELSGVVTAQGAPVPQQFVVVFSSDRAHWFHHSRRVAGALSDASGTYSIRNLPAGEYLVVTSAGISPGEWFDPSLLEQLVPGAVRIELRELEMKKLDLETAKHDLAARDSRLVSSIS
jgi:hypothetical protein